MKLAIFKYQAENPEPVNDFTVIEIDGEPWFVARQVCELLGIVNSSDAVASLDNDEKRVSVIPTPSGNQGVRIINESGLYTLVFRSKKEGAKEFRKWVTREVIPSIRKTGSFGKNRLGTPNFVARYQANWNRVDRGYFSVISELFVRLYGRFEHNGYIMPNKAMDGTEIRPDNSVGMWFSKHLKDHHPDKANTYKMYSHLFPDGSTHYCKQYPNELLSAFIRFIDEEWLPNHAARYFSERDKSALDYLPKLLGNNQPGHMFLTCHT